MTKRHPYKPRSDKGFTILEILVVITIIGLVASIAIPGFRQSRQNSLAARAAHDFRVFTDKFQIFNLEEGYWPADDLPRQVPGGMESYLTEAVWAATTSIGGNWDYDYGVFGVTAAVSIDGYTAEAETIETIDRLLDDGNTNSGRLKITAGNHLSYVLVE